MWSTYDPLCILFLSVLRSIGFLIIFLYDVNCLVFTGRRKGQEFSSLSSSDTICLWRSVKNTCYLFLETLNGFKSWIQYYCNIATFSLKISLIKTRNKLMWVLTCRVPCHLYASCWHVYFLPCWYQPGSLVY